ncbi:hypothetical protein A9Q99_11400 [Gammaproteobacteria bacterium 45_16_T64]|nr:hypothetical protein A9Q99_11400 [Gammaproteobacteria bacterium 45_16_T64]
MKGVPEVEGVIKYRLDYEKQMPTFWEGFAELNAWRNILFQMHLIGQEPSRYGGLGYGNISCRSDREEAGFFISGTQTGGKENLGVSDYCRISQCDIRNNHIVAEGAVKPSSEALSHGSVYQLSPSIGCVIHVHSDVLWRCAKHMSLPMTDEKTPYGTVAMADEIAELYHSGALDNTRLFVMAGHEDGVISFGDTIEQAGAALIAQLSMAIQNFK